VAYKLNKVFLGLHKSKLARDCNKGVEGSCDLKFLEFLLSKIIYKKPGGFWTKIKVVEYKKRIQ